MQLTVWGEVKVISEVALGEFEEFAGQRFLEALTQYSPDFRAVSSVTPSKSEEMGTASWAGKIVHLKLGVYTGDEEIELKCNLWVVRENDQPSRSLVMRIETPDDRSLNLVYDSNGLVRAIYSNDVSIYNVWGKATAALGLPDLRKFFVLDMHSSN